MKNFLINAGTILKRSKYISIAAGIGMLSIAALSLTAYAATRSEAEPPPQIAAEPSETQEQKLTTVQPTLLSSSSSTIILGMVLSHETANIYPRRNGIVEDIYVDIGDTVKKNQVVAILLPKGVEGQSYAAIAEKNARKSQAEVDHLSAISVADETVNNALQKIEEKRTELTVAQSEQGAILRQFVQYQSNVTQMLEQAFISVRNARQLIERILVGSNARTELDIGEEDMNSQLGLLDFEMRYTVIPTFTALYELEEEYLNSDEDQKKLLIQALVWQANDALLKTNNLLAFTPTVPVPQSGKFTQQMLTDMTNGVLKAQNDVLKAKEKYEDAENAYSTLTAKEPQLYAEWKSGAKHISAQSNKVQMLTEQLQTTERNLVLTESQQQQMIEKTKSMVAVADAMLTAETVRSGHRQIRSPFAGTISKRFIDVGQIVMPSMSAFELTDVPTSLAKKAKREIQFGMPEYLQEAIAIGDTVTFFIPEQEEKLYTAIVTRKSPQVDMQTHTVTVQAKLDDSLNLPHNTNVRVRVTDRSTPLFRVPSFAVKRDGEQNILWILNPETGEPENVLVTVRSEDGEFAEVTGDITEDTVVILDPPDLITSMKEKTSS